LFGTVPAVFVNIWLPGAWR